MKRTIQLRHRLVSSFVKSVQRGTITDNGTGAATATINAVDVKNAILIWDGESTSTTGTQQGLARLTLTNATTVTAIVPSGGLSVTASFVVIEFYPGVLRSVQYGTVNAGGTTTITATDMSKTILILLGWQASLNIAGDLRSQTRLSQTNETTISCTSVGTGSGETMSAGFCAAEFL